jgi:thimet oligopeptidase
MAAAPGGEVMAVWNEVHVAVSNVDSVASLLANVHPDEAVRTQAEEAEREADRLRTRIGLDRGLYDVLAAVDPDALDAGGRRVLERSLRDFRRSGVDRDAATRERLRSLADRQTAASQAFARNIREGVGRLSVPPDRLAGLPADFLGDREVGEDGYVRLTTEYPDYIPVMTFAADRSLRRAMLHAFLNRAWPENDAVLRELLEIRRETAHVLGHPDWPSYDAEVKMIGAGPAIAAFIDRVADRAADPASRDYALLLDRLREDHPEATVVDGVDKAYYCELVRRERLVLDAQEVRRYFDFARVRKGLLEVTGRLFGLRYVDVPDAPRWHPDVTVHDVVETGSGRRLGRIHLDLHPRAGKYSHAAQFSLVAGVRGRQLPEGVLVCNFPRGLMDHGSVVTLFHEFGHLLHHVLGGDQDWVRFSGVATEWDFVEAPSQMLEEWAWDHDVLATFAVDADGRPIPADLVRRMRAADEFGKGFQARTQMFYAAVSYWLHRTVPEQIDAVVHDLQARYDLFESVPDTHFHASFGHLGGYGSGYYTYMWSLVIAKDLFSAFDPGDLFAPAVAGRYRDRVLVSGGARDAADLVEDFLGRPYAYDAFEAWLSA